MISLSLGIPPQVVVVKRQSVLLIEDKIEQERHITCLELSGGRAGIEVTNRKVGV